MYSKNTYLVQSSSVVHRHRVAGIVLGCLSSSYLPPSSHPAPCRVYFNHPSLGWDQLIGLSYLFPQSSCSNHSSLAPVECAVRCYECRFSPLAYKQAHVKPPFPSLHWYCMQSLHLHSSLHNNKRFRRSTTVKTLGRNCLLSIERVSDARLLELYRLQFHKYIESFWKCFFFIKKRK